MIESFTKAWFEHLVMENKLYLLQANLESLDRNDNPWYPVANTVTQQVIRAESVAAARQLAHESGGEENEYAQDSERVFAPGWGPWLDPKYTSCEVLSADGDAKVILQNRYDI